MDGPAAAEDRADESLPVALGERFGYEVGHALVRREVTVDERGGLLLRDAQRLSQAERALAINHAEVDRLCAAALGGGDFAERCAEDLAGRERSGVVIGDEGRPEGPDSAVASQDPQFNLR